MGQHAGWLLVVAGLILLGIGLILVFAPSIPWLGRLPGDVVVEREDFRLYFPITTCILVSGLLTLILWLVRLFVR